MSAPVVSASKAACASRHTARSWARSGQARAMRMAASRKRGASRLLLLGRVRPGLARVAGEQLGRDLDAMAPEQLDQEPVLEIEPGMSSKPAIHSSEVPDGIACAPMAKHRPDLVSERPIPSMRMPNIFIFQPYSDP
jgi:hypothetical protein